MAEILINRYILYNIEDSNEKVTRPGLWYFLTLSQSLSPIYAPTESNQSQHGKLSRNSGSAKNLKNPINFLRPFS